MKIGVFILPNCVFDNQHLCGAVTSYFANSLLRATVDAVTSLVADTSIPLTSLMTVTTVNKLICFLDIIQLVCRHELLC